MEVEHSASLFVDKPYDVASTLSLLSMGPGDPCLRVHGADQVRMTLHSPTGPVALRILSAGSVVDVGLHGPGSEWLKRHLPSLLGLNYVPPVISEPPKLRRIAHQFRGLRIPRLPTLSIRVVQVIIQQLMSFSDASWGWQKLVTRYGTPVEGTEDLWFFPLPSTIARLSRHDFTACGIPPRIGERAIRVSRVSMQLEKQWQAGER